METGRAGNQSEAPARLLLVDDQDLFVDLLTQVLADVPDFEVVAVAGTIHDALDAAVGNTKPEIAVIDYRLPDGNGVALAESLQRRTPHIRTVMLTGYDDIELARAALRAGCAGYLSKTAATSDLVDVLRRVRAGGFALDPEVAARIAGADSTAVRRDGHALTPREREVLALLADGFTTRDIAQRLFVSVNTVRNHVQHLMARLGVHSRLEAVARAREMSIVD